MKRNAKYVFCFYNAGRMLQTQVTGSVVSGNAPLKKGVFNAVQQKIRKDFVRLALLIS
ncbi:hypothetical protein ALP98_102004 [Pseudomonas viridiflava]|uniref:Uncharacterized protein n=3 Tax=Pseudomonas syringae group TaxID=136849 RepID=A0A3M4IZN5_PSEVI|nr:hypothetical protein ALQ30_101502 [Pseudomonas syringae pv. persicae]RMQ09795.1 hypothetical protein ALQ09_101359 [Pseudomonas viridiflava]RMQ72185.1 hypothetical protein ALP98_102004 [Pseudomonas viridiflava]RMR53653.1 hypothetical protein ALP83_101277 [Pseudomonas syringae pv. actinidiae]